jgi:hypothetical protein
MSDALFAKDGAHYVPSEITRGPWSPDALHGGPVSALLAGLAEGLEKPVGLAPARITIELLRPVPLAPLRGAARVLRPGKKVMLAESSLHAGDVEVARATLLFVRTAELPLPAETIGGTAVLPPLPDTALRTKPIWDAGLPAYHRDAVEHRVVRGVWGRPGPCTDWIRLRVPVVAGEATTPFQRVAAAADFGNGISGALPFGAWRFINPDLTIHLARLPRGEWVCLDAVTWPEPNGIGLAESELFDESGRIGRSLQTLLLERS